MYSKNVSLFIAQKIRHTEGESFSATVARIGVGGIALGLAVMIISFAILGGFKQKIYQKIFSFGAHLQVTNFESDDSYMDEPVPLNTRLYKNYDKIPGIAHVQVFGQKLGLLKTDQNVQGVVLKGVGKDFNFDSFQSNMVEGDFIRFKDTTYSQDIVISRRISRQLNLKLGDRVFVYFLRDQKQPRVRRLTISGVYETGMEEFDEAIVLSDIALLQRMNDWSADKVGGYEIFLKNFASLEQVQAKVYNQMEYYMKVVPVTEKYIQIFEWLTLLNRNVAIFLALILFVACFNMVAIVLILIMERTQMIGLLKAVGASNSQLRNIFMVSGVRLVVEGIFWGNVIGLGLCALQYFFKIIPLDQEAYYMSYVPIEWDFSLILLLNVGIFVLVATVLLIPTAIISRIQPVKALRFD